MRWGGSLAEVQVLESILTQGEKATTLYLVPTTLMAHRPNRAADWGEGGQLAPVLESILT